MHVFGWMYTYILDKGEIIIEEYINNLINENILQTKFQIDQIRAINWENFDKTLEYVALSIIFIL